MAIATAALATIIYIVVNEARERSDLLVRELKQLRTDIAPTLDTVRRFGEQGLDLAKLAHDEAREIIDTTRRVRYDAERAVKHARRRLADFDAVIEVVQEEVEETALQLTSTLHNVRTGTGMIEQLRRLIRPRRRGRR
jgi:uncharacterized protein YhaN